MNCYIKLFAIFILTITTGCVTASNNVFLRSDAEAERMYHFSARVFKRGGEYTMTLTSAMSEIMKINKTKCITIIPNYDSYQNILSNLKDRKTSYNMEFDGSIAGFIDLASSDEYLGQSVFMRNSCKNMVVLLGSNFKVR